VVSGEDPYSGIFDFSKVVEDVVSSEGIGALARKAAIILSGKLRVVVANTPSLHGLFRMYEMSRDGMRVDLQVVESIDEAYRMFGVHPEDFSKRLSPGIYCGLSHYRSPSIAFVTALARALIHPRSFTNNSQAIEVVHGARHSNISAHFLIM
jgi:hypothetical protein